MKRAKVCALLCVAALSVNPVLPAMAAESTVESTEALETTVDEETGNEQEKTNEEKSVVPGGENQTVEQEVTEQQNPAAEAATESDDAIPQEGWYTDENGDTYYYENGKKVCGQIKEIEGWGYYFKEDGTVLRNDGTWVLSGGYVQADDSGHLYSGWHTIWGDTKSYFDENYFQYRDKILEQDGKQYYFDGIGSLVTNMTIIVEDIPYKADENGVLTKENVESTGWVSSNGSWYYYEDNQLVKDDYRVINGVEYHFNYDGQMSTEVFWDNGEYRLAEPDGRIVRHAVGWYYSQQRKSWFYFKSTDSVARRERIQINGKEYAFGWEGQMQTGTFYSDGEWVYADASGAIVTKDGWQILNGEWYYIQNGQLVMDTMIDIKNATYIFDSDGKMETGLIRKGDFESYVTNASGAIVKNDWVRSDLAWVYAGADGKLLTSQWKDGYYLTEDGTMAIGEVTIDGKNYVFDENGHQEGIVGSKAGWQKYDGQWYYYTEDGEPYDGWLNNTWYISDGRMETNALVPSQKDKEEKSYVGPDGKIQNGWIKRNYSWGDVWYYSKNNQVIRDDWCKIDGVWYYFLDEIMMFDDVMEIDGKVYQFDASGRCLGQIKKAGWIKKGSWWYYINDNLTLNTEAIMEIGGKTYYFYDSGTALITNEAYTLGNTTVWIDANGNLDTTDGWKLSRYGAWYYQENGKFVHGDKVINGQKYHFDDYGRMDYGIMQTESGAYTYTDANGNVTKLNSGWYHLNQYGSAKWYYFVNGKPAQGWLNGYYFVYNGKMCDNIWWGGEGLWYAFDSNGHLRTNQWFVEDGCWYYAGSTGRLYTGERTVGGKTYWFDSDGVWVK